MKANTASSRSKHAIPGTAGDRLGYAAPAPLTARIPSATSETGIARSTLYKLAGEGKIRFVKIGDSTFVDMESLRGYLRGLPSAPIRKGA